jgi:hypothetical protein
MALLSPLALRRSRAEAAIALTALVVWTVLVASFVSGPAYWNQYNAHLALPWAVLVGLGVAEAARWATTDVRRRALAAAFALALLPAGRELAFNRPRAQKDVLALNAALRELVPTGGCIYAFVPGLLFAGVRLPPVGPPAVVDSYGAMLLAGRQAGAGDLRSVFDHPKAQALMRERIASCGVVVIGWRGDWQLSEATKAWLRSENRCRLLYGFETCLHNRD